jgi:D-serine deaminase-like pyridoxal phosphate-dependent protein
MYVTCDGGGYVASGAIDRDKAPEPWLPRGLSLLRHEMAGEVQTPLEGKGAHAIALGEPVVFRHAKAGEVCERFAEALLVSGGRVVDRVPTYRGDGQTFF